MKTENEPGQDRHFYKPDLDFNDKGINVYQALYPIHAYEVDPQGNLSVLSVCNFLMDAGSAHSVKLGISVLDLQNKNYTWVLARMKLKMHAYPICRKQVKVHTWPSGGDRFGLILLLIKSIRWIFHMFFRKNWISYRRQASWIDS
ncbi:MAG: thioesterase [Desulfobacterales bacterium]|nr:thioesterase [Desulfobacterales bacterium]MDD4391554.1 thioesterase [Desulfobacterales bacterium]